MERMDGYIRDAILKMRLIHRQTVRSVPAFFKAVSEGVKEFDAICIVGGKGGVVTEYAPPCGVCRQVMMEFCDPETFQIILAIDAKQYDIYTLKEMLPKGFGPSNLTE